MKPEHDSPEEKKPSVLRRFMKLPDSRPHWLLTLVILLIVIFLLIKMAG